MQLCNLLFLNACKCFLGFLIFPYRLGSLKKFLKYHQHFISNLFLFVTYLLQRPVKYDILVIIFIDIVLLLLLLLLLS